MAKADYRTKARECYRMAAMALSRADLEGTKVHRALRPIFLTPLADAIATTLAWHRAHPEVRLNA